MTIAVTRAAEGLERRAFTVAAFERMAEFGIVGHDERLELIGGEVVPMSAKGSRHEGIKTSINFHWGRACPDGYMFSPETGLRLDEHTYLEPDFIVYAHTKPLSQVKGPDVLLVVEVADSSLDYDLRRKPLVYASFGVRELWVIDAARRIVHRHREPRATSYAMINELPASERLVPAFAPAAFAFALDGLAEV
jgi:Uma2 family endonuclease